MLRPATPLAIILLIAFILLLLSTLSTPIIKSIPLATYKGWKYGVFGGCNSTHCVGPAVGYDADELFSESPIDEKNDFSLAPEKRHSLSSLLIVHPIAAFCTLVCFALALVAHFRGPSHSPRFLLALLILTIPTLLVTLLAFLVDILFFVPHLSWGGWIVLVATILIVCSMVVSCAMRRTLVSRKARKKRIDENPDMNGANYYDSLAQQRMLVDQLPRADSPPPLSDSINMDKAGPRFAQFEMHRPDTNSRDGRPSLDDRTPLNPHRDPSFRSASTGGQKRPYAPGEDVPMMPMNNRTSADSGAGRPPGRRPSRDQYGNIIPPAEQMAFMGELPPPGLRHQGSQGSLSSRGSGGRGRGGYGPPPRGFVPPRGGYGQPRVGYGTPPRGGFGPRGGFKGGPPPPGWNGRGRGGYGPPPASMRGRGGGPRPGPPPGYLNDPYYGGPPPRNGPPPSFDQAAPSAHYDFAPTPGIAIGQAIEMDERTGSAPGNNENYLDSYGHRDPERLVSGLDSAEHDANNLAVPAADGRDGEHGARSPTSIYTDRPTTTSPAAQWGHEAHLSAADLAGEYTQLTLDTVNPTATESPLHERATQSTHVPPVSPIHDFTNHQHGRTLSEPYYEDVDPRFATEDPQPIASAFPTSLTPGSIHPQSSLPQPNNPPIHHAFLAHDPNIGYLEPIPDGTRSPAEGSEASHFTSVSQRGINPNWRPGPGSVGSAGRPPPLSSARQRNDDILLNGNPDFSLPGLSAPGRVRGGRGGSRGSMIGGGGGRGAHIRTESLGLTPGGRYPSPTDI